MECCSHNYDCGSGVLCPFFTLDAAHLLQGFLAVHNRHENVQANQVVGMSFFYCKCKILYRLGTILCCCDDLGVICQDACHQLPPEGIVLNNQTFHKSLLEMKCSSDGSSLTMPWNNQSIKLDWDSF